MLLNDYQYNARAVSNHQHLYHESSCRMNKFSTGLTKYGAGRLFCQARLNEISVHPGKSRQGRIQTSIINTLNCTAFWGSNKVGSKPITPGYVTTINSRNATISAGKRNFVFPINPVTIGMRRNHDETVLSIPPVDQTRYGIYGQAK